jgi:hypothetical protein
VAIALAVMTVRPREIWVLAASVFMGPPEIQKPPG